MSRLLISCLFIISLLFMGIEGAMDSVGGEHPHAKDSVHLADNDSSPSTDIDGIGDHCQHGCHGHASSISGHLIAIICDCTDQRFPSYNVNFANFAQAPPTPPPNV